MNRLLKQTVREQTTSRASKGGLRGSREKRPSSQLSRSDRGLALKRHHEQMQELRAIRGLLENLNRGSGVEAETPGAEKERVKGWINEICEFLFPISPRAEGGKLRPKCKCKRFSATQKCPSKPQTDPERDGGNHD
jgi:hypothetical protein